jgi:hypothetical protein
MGMLDRLTTTLLSFVLTRRYSADRIASPGTDPGGRPKATVMIVAVPPTSEEQSTYGRRPLLPRYP